MEIRSSHPTGCPPGGTNSLTGQVNNSVEVHVALQGMPVRANIWMTCLPAQPGFGKINSMPRQRDSRILCFAESRDVAVRFGIKVVFKLVLAGEHELQSQHRVRTNGLELIEELGCQFA